jgi:hypothetical protein
MEEEAMGPSARRYLLIARERVAFAASDTSDGRKQDENNLKLEY